MEIMNYCEEIEHTTQGNICDSFENQDPIPLQFASRVYLTIQTTYQLSRNRTYKHVASFLRCFQNPDLIGVNKMLNIARPNMKYIP